MNIEYAEQVLRSERQAYWGHITNVKLKRRVQNRINKYVQRWKELFYLETAEDCLSLACELKDMRQGRARKREGRLKRPEDRSKRRSQRLAEKRRKPDDTERPEVNSLFNSAIDFGFDQVVPSEEDVNSTEISASYSLDTPIGGEFSNIMSKGTPRTPNSISSSFFDLCNTQPSSRDSGISLLVGDPWYHSDDVNHPAHYFGTDLADKWVGSPQEEFSARDLLESDRQEPYALSIGVGDKWTGMNQTVVQPSGPTPAPPGDLYTHGPMDSTSVGIDCAQTWSSGTSHAPVKVGNRIQQLREYDEAQFGIIMTTLKAQLQERLGSKVQNGPELGRQPLGEEQKHLGPLIEQCLITLRGSIIHKESNEYQAEPPRCIEQIWDCR